MQIRKANLEDLEGICKVASSVKIDYEHPQESGFLVYVLNSEEYKDRIQRSNHFYVAVEDNQVKGFLMCYDDRTLNQLLEEGSVTHEDQLPVRVSSQEEPYIFGDQIGITTSFKGTGQMLIQELFNNMRAEGISIIYVGILHSPALNIASKTFCEKLGFRCVEEVRNKDEHVWGVYSLDL